MAQEAAITKNKLFQFTSFSRPTRAVPRAQVNPDPTD